MENDSEFDLGEGTRLEDVIEYSAPFPVGIAKDYRNKKPEEDLSGHRGFCLGMFGYKPAFQRLGELEKLTHVSQISLIRNLNPLIYVPSQGAYIWGIDSDWCRLDCDNEVAELARQAEENATKGRDPFLDKALTEVAKILSKKQ